MKKNNNNWEFDLNEYIKEGEPNRVEKSKSWKTAIGLQDVDGLKTSSYLLGTAKEHIEGKIDIKTAKKRIESYYEERKNRERIEEDTKEADIVSTRIAELLGERAFSFSPIEENTAIKIISYFKDSIRCNVHNIYATGIYQIFLLYLLLIYYQYFLYIFLLNLSLYYQIIKIQ